MLAIKMLPKSMEFVLFTMDTITLPMSTYCNLHIYHDYNNIYKHACLKHKGSYEFNINYNIWGHQSCSLNHGNDT